MKSNTSHLVLYEKTLSPGKEWDCDLPGWSFLHVRDGDGLLLEPDRPRMLAEGNSVMRGPGHRCVIRASNLNPMQLEYFFVQPELLTGILNLVDCQQLQNKRSTKPVRLFAARHDLGEQFRALACQARANQHMEARCAMLSLASTVLREVLIAQPTPSAHRLTAEGRLKTFIREIPAAELRDLPLAEAARRCGCSVRHFSRLFKTSFGVSMLAKQIELRLQCAQQLLLGTDAKIITIALDSGFQRVGLFTTMFKRRFKMTPSEWRQRHGASPGKTRPHASPRVKPEIVSSPAG